MKSYFFKLIPPRPNFAQTMTPDEAALMRDHVAYWMKQMEQGLVIAFGPVVEPTLTYGIGILQLPDAMEARQLTDQDPTILSNTGFKVEVHLTPKLVVATARGQG